MAKTVTEGFQAFLNRLEPLPIEIEKNRRHRGSIKSCLENNFDCKKFFETGSIGNGTGIRHYSDTDYFAQLPVRILSNDSSYFLRKLKKGLGRTFWNTYGIEVKAPAVVLPFGQYASEDIEITPCHFVGMSDTMLGRFPKYSIPDGNKEWMFSSPDAHNAYVDHYNQKLRGKLKPLIKFIKAWKFINNVPILSFHLELRITKFLEESIVFSYDENIHNIFTHLYDKELAGIQDPMGISGIVPATYTLAKRNRALSKLERALGRSEKAYKARVRGNDVKAFEWWDKIYNGKFPAR